MKYKKHIISEKVLKRIKTGEVSMRPAIYFSLLSVSIIITSILAGVVMSYLSSILFFWTKIIISDSKSYGLHRNLNEIISTFPWWTIILFVILLVFIIFLIRRYGNLYRQKSEHILIIILSATLIIGFVMSNFNIGRLNHSGRNNNQEIPRWQIK